ncbi:MAG: hypothetical protein KAH38_10055 [Candidatus Hydrogenedentes bacterium]|nr:hypothetical protein [Candidatus Hydrogenedentota bacterium]
MRIAIIGNQCAGKTTLAEAYGAPIVKFAEPFYNVLRLFEKPKNRAFMQGLSDVAKECFGDEIFTELFAKKMEWRHQRFADFWMCDDVRYLHEVKWLKANGWKLIFLYTETGVRRVRAAALGLEFITNHPSEIQVPELVSHCDLWINNTSLSLQELKDTGKQLREVADLTGTLGTRGELPPVELVRISKG